MTSKRGMKKGVSPKVGNSPDVIRRGVSGRFVSVSESDKAESVVTPVEARAEQEPAVVVGPTPAEIARAVDASEALGDWAPAPVQLNWWQRVLAHMRTDRRERKAEMAEHLAAVKAGVLQELEVIGAKKGVALKGSPFSTVMLPVAKKKRSSRWGYIAAALLVFVGLMVWIGSREDSPAVVLGQVENALRKHDVRAFDAKVDVASLASSLVNQMFGVPEGTPVQVQGMASRLAAFVKPGLADSLKEEILSVVAGDVKLDDSGNTMLGKLWYALGADKVRVGNARISVQDENMAVAEVPLTRTDLGLTLPLQVVLGKTNGDWEVVDVPNVTAVLGRVIQAEQVLDERRQQAVMEAAAAKGVADVRVESVSKAKSPMPGSSNLMVTLVLVNDGGIAVDNAQIDVAFGDAAGQPMMITRLTLDGELPAKARREQVWSVPVDRNRAAERYVADLPLTALSVTATIVR